MPELPDVENFRRVVDGGGLGCQIAGVAVDDDRILESVTPRRLGARLRGAAFVETRRHGKHLLVRYAPGTGDGGWVTLHFGMTGGVARVGQGESQPPYTRVRFDFEDGGHLAYTSRRMLGHVGLADDADAFIRSHQLGPDALDPGFDNDAFADCLRDVRREIKSALMDQTVIAGLGNVYVDEILFQARLHPKTRLETLDDKALRDLYRVMRRVLKVAIRNGAGTEEVSKRLPSGYLLPHRTKGARCPRCGTTLAKETVAGRTTWYCPRCQPEPGKA